MSITSPGSRAAEEVTQKERERESMRKSRVYDQRISPRGLEAFCGECYTYCFNDLGFFSFENTNNGKTDYNLEDDHKNNSNHIKTRLNPD